MSEKRDDGGPAFAALATTAMGDVHHQEGMTYRQWLVGHILPALILNEGVASMSRPKMAQTLAKEAASLADAAIAVLEEPS